MLLTKEVEVKLWSSNIKYYEGLGYKIPRSAGSNGNLVVVPGTTIVVRIEDLQPYSQVFVDVLCDNCETNVSHIRYRDYTNYSKNGVHFCPDCANVRREQTCMERYGCINVFQTQDVKTKSKETSMERYGVEYASQSVETKEKRKQTSLRKYGVEWPILSDVVREKISQSLYRNGTVPTSSQQFCIYNMLRDYYGDDMVKLNYPCGNSFLDIVVMFNDVNIDIEYDCWVWHQDSNKDRRRDEFVKTQGYRILRVKSGRDIPNFVDLIGKIEALRDGKYTYCEIVLSDWETTQNECGNN